MKDLSVQVRDYELIVTRPSNGQSVTYRGEFHTPMLVALDSLKGHLNAERLAFLAQAWRAAHAKAKELGWL